jgi:hypothetical protein
MHLIKSANDKIILFDDNGIFIFNDSSIRKDYRIFSLLFIFSIAIVGIIMNLSVDRFYSLLAFSVLLLYGLIHLYFFILRNKKVPEQLSYAEIERIDFVTSSQRQAIIIYSKESKRFKFFTKNLNTDIINFIEGKNHFIVNR